MSFLLKRYINLVLEGDRLARVPQQLLSPSDGKNEKSEKEKDEAEDVKEFSGAGGAAGYTMPLGAKKDD